ncbi:MAG TPA: glycosyltransferase [Chloroflexia bacterium]|nr:glycosyltransferase [Chloroflexia bacterium]
MPPATERCAAFRTYFSHIVKLAIVIPGFQAGERDWCIPAFTNLAQELSMRNETHVFALRYPHARGEYSIGSVRVHALGGGRLLGRRVRGISLGKLWADTLRGIAREHGRAPFDAVVGIWATESGWLAAQAARSLGVPSLVHVAGGEPVYLPSLRYGYLRKGLDGVLLNHTLAIADRITAPSRQLLNTVVIEFPPSKQNAVRWPLGVDTARFARTATQRPRTEPTRFVSVGSLIPVKDHTWLVRSLADLRLRRPDLDARLSIAGEGPLKPYLQRLVDKLHLRGYVTLLGEVPHDTLPELHERAHAFVLGSWHEAQCMAALEAMSSGLPWIAPAVGALADLAEDQARSGAPSGVLVAERSTYAMSRSMETVADLPADEYEKWSDNAAAGVRRNYDLATQTERLERLLARLTQLTPR